jgi:ribose/xylose/arabinose/galactoside ABC-type transport system permease subunit
MTTAPSATLAKAMPRSGKYIPVFATLALLVIVFAAGSMAYPKFMDIQVILNLFIDNGFLLVVAIGMTFVILSGGIDLSVGAVVALSTVMCAFLVQEHHWPAFVAMPLVLVMGSALGLGMGAVIHYFEIQPFIVTLAGMFLARGLCYVISVDAISIDDSVFTGIAQTRLHFDAPAASSRGGIVLQEVFISPSVVISLLTIAAAFFVLHYRRLGRNVYAIGGNEQSALLMGLPVARTKLLVYTISGFCSALGGLLLTFYMLSGYTLHAVGMELDAIAAVVIGGTVLTGGSGYVIGTVLGVLVLGMIQTIINFQGTLSSWWTRIVEGVLLLLFIVLQRAIGLWRTK